MKKQREANKCMNGELVREEIEEAMKEMRESAPGEDGIRMCYLKEACEEVKDALIGMVQFMFEERGTQVGWDKWLKGGVICPRRERKGITEGLCCLRWGAGC